jgi:hypothetical protein
VRQQTGQRLWARLAGLLLGLSGTLALATPPLTASEFTWRAPLDLPAGASLVRVDLPAAALQTLQTSDAGDLRVFNAAGRPPVPGSVQVRVDTDGAQPAVWVHLEAPRTGTSPPAATQAPLPAAIFTTQTQKSPISALIVQASLPANQPVPVNVSTSTDLTHWTPVAVRGPLYRFEGDSAPVNDQLEFEVPLSLEGRYLRLDWPGHDAVRVSAVTGLIAAPTPAPARLRVSLGPVHSTSPAAWIWQTGFSTPVAALALGTSQPNTLLPVHILGRNDTTQAWRTLARTVVYRLGPAGHESVNPPVALGGTPVRWLRVEASHGMSLDAVPLEAAVEFEPLQLVFLATGNGPFVLAAGRPGTASAALPLATLTGPIQERVQDLPLARIGPVQIRSTPPASPLQVVLPEGLSTQAAVLWAVLLLGVAVLGAVAWSLLRQTRPEAPPPPP